MPSKYIPKDIRKKESWTGRLHVDDMNTLRESGISVSEQIRDAIEMYATPKTKIVRYLKRLKELLQRVVSLSDNPLATDEQWQELINDIENTLKKIK